MSLMCFFGHKWVDSTCVRCGKHNTNQRETTLPEKDSLTSTKPAVNPTSVAGFIMQAMKGAAYVNLPVRELKDAASGIAKVLMEKGVSSSDIPDLYNDSLLAICPKCHDYLPGRAILMLETFAMAGNVMFTGNSGGGERLMEGKCKSYSCDNTKYDLYWCPDLDPRLLQEIATRYAINIDKNINQKRKNIWQPDK